ncbi:MAG: Fe-S cluster assembly sulfur transfer protein SufU [Rhizomicrobium sp.]
MDLRELYQDIILDHGRHPRNFRSLAGASHFAHGHNPLCGDKVTVYLKIEDDRIAAVSFEGHGCAISTASASLMTEILTNKTLAEADLLFKSFHGKVTGGDEPEMPPMLEEDCERLEPLTGVRTYPARVKCATLAWHTFEAAVNGGAIAAPIKTE